MRNGPRARRGGLWRNNRGIVIRRALRSNADGTVAAGRIHSAIEHVRSIEVEVRYLESLSHRVAFHVAVDAADGVGGFQGLALWAPLFTSMARDVNWRSVVGRHRIPWTSSGI